MDRKAREPARLRRRWPWKLGAFAERAMVLLGGIARRLKYPIPLASVRSLAPPLALASVPVSAALLSRVDSVSTEQHLDEVAQLFVAGRVAQLPVMDHGVPVGVVTRDAVTCALQSSGPHALVGTLTSRQVVTVAPSDALGDVLERLRATPDSVALIVDHGLPVGVLTEDLLVAYAASRRS